MLAGILNVILIAHFLSPAEQGYYYTFSSLVAIQIVFELGFSFVILQMAAHERTRLTRFDSRGVEGDHVAHARLASIFQKAVRWYTRASAIMGVCLLLAGVRFFSTHTKSGTHVHWLLPWCLDAVAAAVVFQVDPIVSFLEGCGWVNDVARLRFTQALLSSLLGWGALLFHEGLFAPSMMIAGQAIVGLYFILRTHGKLLGGLLRHRVADLGVSWKTEIWPFQWRIAISWASAYFIFQLFNPVLFAYAGPVAAGRMGMSLNICSSLTAVGLAWVTTKAARFGSLVATKQIAELDALFSRTVIQSGTLLFVCEVAVLIGLSWAIHYMPKLAGRILPLPTFALLLLTILLSHFVTCEAYYLRAHKEEPFLWFWIWIALASVVSVTWAGKHFGATGVTVAYFVSGGLLRFSAGTFVFFRKRREWHGKPSGPQEQPVY
jgi:hypothetical protein